MARFRQKIKTLILKARRGERESTENAPVAEDRTPPIEIKDDDGQRLHKMQSGNKRQSWYSIFQRWGRMYGRRDALRELGMSCKKPVALTSMKILREQSIFEETITDALQRYSGIPSVTPELELFTLPGYHSTERVAANGYCENMQISMCTVTRSLENIASIGSQKGMSRHVAARSCPDLRHERCSSDPAMETILFANRAGALERGFSENNKRTIAGLSNVKEYRHIFRICNNEDRISANFEKDAMHDETPEQEHIKDPSFTKSEYGLDHDASVLIPMDNNAAIVENTSLALLERSQAKHADTSLPQQNISQYVEMSLPEQAYVQDYGIDTEDPQALPCAIMPNDKREDEQRIWSTDDSEANVTQENMMAGETITIPPEKIDEAEKVVLASDEYVANQLANDIVKYFRLFSDINGNRYETQVDVKLAASARGISIYNADFWKICKAFTAAHLKLIFDIMDRDNDGYIAANEIISEIKKLGDVILPENLERNLDMFISFQQFVQFCDKMDEDSRIVWAQDQQEWDSLKYTSSNQVIF